MDAEPHQLENVIFLVGVSEIDGAQHALIWLLLGAAQPPAQIACRAEIWVNDAELSERMRVVRMIDLPLGVGICKAPKLLLRQCCCLDAISTDLWIQNLALRCDALTGQGEQMRMTQRRRRTIALAL